jgi:hypothetical protein
MKLASLVLGLLLAGVLASVAQARPTTIQISDRGGDAPDPQLDIRTVSVSYDRATGILSGSITLTAPPTPAIVNGVSLYLGRYEPIAGYCNDRLDVDATMSPDGSAFTPVYPTDADNSVGVLPTSISGSTVTFTSLGAAPNVVELLKRGRFTCVSSAYAWSAAGIKVVDKTRDAPIVSGPVPRCRVTRRTVRAGTPWRIRCAHVRGRVQAKLVPKHKKQYLHGKFKVRHGILTLPTDRSMRDRWKVALFKGEIAVGRFEGRVR